MIDTLIISDIHLGSSVCDRDKVLEVLSCKFNNLVINGDLFDNHSFKRYNKKDWKILSKIRKLSKTHNVVLVKGNHDGCADFLAAITGMEFVSEYSFTIENMKYHCEHGDAYDHWIKYKPVATFIFTGIYYWIQKFDRRHIITRRLKRWSKSWVKAKDLVSRRFIEKKGYLYDVLIAGHTHYPESIYSRESSCYYVNTGSFCDERCSYITVHTDGSFDLKYI
jgi:UDP-2,3-diacylglucosamine pyrophosphatase LpxH